MKAFKRAYCFQIKRLQLQGRLQTHKTLNEIAKDREDCLHFNINKVAAFKAIRRLRSPSFSLYWRSYFTECLELFPLAWGQLRRANDSITQSQGTKG